MDKFFNQEEEFSELDCKAFLDNRKSSSDQESPSNEHDTQKNS
jgi:hypothetical protein